MSGNQAQNSTVVRFGKNINIRADQPMARFDHGLSKAYAAYDDTDKGKKLVALVAGVECFPRWTEEKLYTALADPSFIRLLGSGIVRWPLDGRQKYVFLYQADIGECLVKPGQFAQTSWRHPETVAYFVQPMARMLKEMWDRNFRHGGIRPDNIFYAQGDKNRAVTLGDCLSAYPMRAQPSLFLPIDKALADPMGRGGGSNADDIYAFGVSLALFLRRGDEFSGMSDVDIVRRKIELGSYAAIIGAERFQASFMELLRGVLHDDARLRWTVDEIFAWLDGTRLTPAPIAKRKKASRPIMFMNKKYLFADLLAVDLHTNPNEVAELVGAGILGEWIEKSLNNKQMYEAYQDILERLGSVSQHKDMLVTRLTMLFNSDLPIHYRRKIFTYDGIGGVLADAAHREADLSVYQEAIVFLLPDHALVEKSVSQNEILIMVKLYDKCRAALKQKRYGFGIEKCLYILCPHAACLSPQYKGFFINGQSSALLAFEKMSANNAQTALYLDVHAIAFFSVFSGGAMDKCLFDLNSKEKDSQIAGNLRFLAFLQRKAKDVTVQRIASVFADALSGVYKSFRNKALRKQVEEAVREAAQAGDLVKMSALLDDQGTLAKDQNAFARAMQEYRFLQNEYNDYNARLANKGTYGAANGRDVAAIVSWGIATMITLMVVLAFLSGYQIF